VFYDKELRVQKWDVAGHERVWLHQLSLSTDCLESSLSPSGEVLACLNPEFDLQLIEVSSNKPLYSRSKFYSPSWLEILQIFWNLQQDEPFRPLLMRFSPDDHYFLIGHSQTVFGYDLQARAEIKLSGAIKQIMAYSFTFISPDEVAGYDPVGFYKN